MKDTYDPDEQMLFTVVVKRTALYKETVTAADADEAVELIMNDLDNCEPIDGTTEVYDVWEVK